MLYRFIFSFSLLFIFNKSSYGFDINSPFITYNLNLEFSKKIGLQLDGNWLNYNHTLILHDKFTARLIGIYNVKVKNEKLKMNIGLGYAFRENIFQLDDGRDSTYVYAEYRLEHIITQQIQFIHSINAHFKMLHRFRFEEVFHNEFSNSFSTIFFSPNSVNLYNRYLIRPEIVLLGLNKPVALYAAVQEELFIKLYNIEYGESMMRENRLSINLGLKIKNHTQFEIGYMNNYTNGINLLKSSENMQLIQIQMIQFFSTFKKIKEK